MPYHWLLHRHVLVIVTHETPVKISAKNRKLGKSGRFDVHHYMLRKNWLNLWCSRLKPQSDIRCNRFATSPQLTISTDRRGRNKVPDRSRRGCREVGDWSGTSLRPNQSQPGFCACTKTWLRLIWSQTGPGKVADQSPISRRLVADRSPTNFVRIGAWLSLKLVGDRSVTGRRSIGD